MNIIVAVLIFSVIVIIHELGHFLLAVKNGILVTEFSIGMGPRIITLAKTEKGYRPRFFINQRDFDTIEEWKNSIKYSLKLFPIGGSCMMLGDDELCEDDRAFNKKGVWARISVIFAGPLFNFIFIFILALFITGTVGYDPAVITDVKNNSSTELAGLKVGDVITNFEGRNINISRELDSYLNIIPLSKEKVNLTYERDGVSKIITIQPEPYSDRYSIGGASINRDRVKTGVLDIIKYSAVEVKFVVVSVMDGLSQMIKGKVSTEDIAGPVGIFNMNGNVYEISKSDGIVFVFVNLSYISILLSANFGVINLLPLPALDGGRLVFLFLEVLRGKPISQTKEGFVHTIGLISLMCLMVFILFNDISKLI
jgi:regulator of sigma E protease